MKTSGAMVFLLAGSCCVLPARAFDPLTGVISKGISTALDVRTANEVKLDVEIDTALSKRFFDHKGEDFKYVSVLVFARHGVLVGFVRDAETRRKAEGLVRGDKRLKSLRNDIQVGKAGGGMAGDTLLEKKIDLKLTATRGVSSVNMRWKAYGSEVFLTGVAASAAEAGLAVKTVKATDGVRVVHSSLRVGKK